MSASESAKSMTKVAALAAEEKVAENMVALDVSKPFVLSDVFLFVSGRNERQVAAISDGIEEKMIEAKYKLLRKEGKETGRWILLDYGDLIVHVMHEQERMFYDIERLWKDAPVLKL